MRSNSFPRRGWSRLWTILALLPILGGALWVAFARNPESPSNQSDVPRKAPGITSAAIADFFVSDRIRDNGFDGAVQLFAHSVQDPSSFADISRAYQKLGYRQIAMLQPAIDHPETPLDRRLEAMMQTASYYLYEGDFQEASTTLARARALAETAPDIFPKRLLTLMFLQGVAALRRGETENCVECGCESSCIFPLQPRAFHQKRSGSADAVKYFTEYLELQPADLGARWLLNVAYMTLGEYPDQVPPEHLIPLESFKSEFDIGRFTDLGASLGVNRLDLSGGAIMDDFDNDGLLDIVETTIDPGVPMAFYRNKGDGTFEERAKAAGLTNQLGGLYCVQTDYNNDGWLDIYVCRGAWMFPQRHSLLRNNKDGTFTDVTKEAGLDAPVMGQVAVWADYDNDGFLDLFVGAETGRSRLYHNRGDGTFEEVALKAGVANEGFICKGANWGDFNGDRYPDLYVANLNGPPRLFSNNRDGTFTDVAPELGITKPRTGFSCWFFDYDNDGWPDIFATSYVRSLCDVMRSHLGQPHMHESCRLYRNLEGKGFQDVTVEAGLDLAMVPMGSNFLDVDNDGYLDFYLGTGDPTYTMLVPNRMFRNVQGKRFSDITTSSGTGHLQKGHAVACGDWDRDGNVDMYVQLGGAVPGDRFRNVLFQNPGHDNHWLTIKLVGKKTNRPAIGARIKLVAGGAPGQVIYRHVTSGSSFGGNALQQTLGIGKAGRIARLEIYWPTSDTTQVFHEVPVDQAIEVTEFESAYRSLNWTRLPVPTQTHAKNGD